MLWLNRAFLMVLGADDNRPRIVTSGLRAYLDETTRSALQVPLITCAFKINPANSKAVGRPLDDDDFTMSGAATITMRLQPCLGMNARILEISVESPDRTGERFRRSTDVEPSSTDTGQSRHRSIRSRPDCIPR